MNNDNEIEVKFENKNGDITSVLSKNVFSVIPSWSSSKFMKTNSSKSYDSANSLDYRNHISVHVTVDKKLFDDNWIYIHSPNLKMARIADFTNFSDDMSVDGAFPLTLEYFCFEEDEIWTSENSDIINFAVNELREIFKIDFQIIHSDVSRNSKAYPVIKTGYQEHINIIKDWLSGMDNVTAIGRSGMFKYNNQDHAMATGLYAARTLKGEGNFDPWEVNVDGEYHEEIL